MTNSATFAVGRIPASRRRRTAGLAAGSRWLDQLPPLVTTYGTEFDDKARVMLYAYRTPTRSGTPTLARQEGVCVEREGNRVVAGPLEDIFGFMSPAS